MKSIADTVHQHGNNGVILYAGKWQ